MEESTGSTATAKGTNSDATVQFASDSTAKATGVGSTAVVLGTSDMEVAGSTAINTNGTTTTVVTSDTTSINGIVQDPRVEMTPVADVHELLMMPPTPLP